jgi:hypothetical protein
MQGEARIIEEENIQREISQIRERNAREGIEAQFAYELRMLRDTQTERMGAINEQNNLALAAQMELERESLANTSLTEEERNRIIEQGIIDREKIDEDYANSIIQLRENTAERERQIEEEKNRAIEQAYKESLQRQLATAQEYLSAASSIASSISTIWNNSIDRETEARLRANDEAIQSDEERAKAEKKIMIEAAYEKYKADLFAWSANCVMATAQAGMAVLKALAEGGPIGGPIMAALVTAMGAMQVAAVISARPKPPQFHSGGVVPGSAGQEVPAILMSGETVTTGKQFENVMQAFANVANMRGGGTEMSVNVYNNAANDVSVSQRMTPEGLKIVVTKIVNESLSNGSLSAGLSAEKSYARGPALS